MIYNCKAKNPEASLEGLRKTLYEGDFYIIMRAHQVLGSTTTPIFPPCSSETGDSSEQFRIFMEELLFEF